MIHTQYIHIVQYQYGSPEVKEASLKRIIISETQQVLQYINGMTTFTRMIVGLWKFSNNEVSFYDAFFKYHDIVILLMDL